MSGYVVDQVTEVTFMEGRDDASLKPVKGWLGVGHIDGERGRREIFGEVMHGDRDYRAFTMRCYEIDESLQLDRMSQEGLVIDAGTSRNKVVVPADQIQLALSQLPRPLSRLQVGDTIGLRRNPDHPAWKDRVEGEYGIEFVAKPDFDPVLMDGARITERTDITSGPRPGVQLRAQNGFWYTSDGMQEDARATMIVSQTALDGSVIVPEPVEPVLAATPAPVLAATPAPVRVEVAAPVAAAAPVSPEDRLDQVIGALDEQLSSYATAVQQWNPHNPKMQPRIEAGRRLIERARNEKDRFSTMGAQLVELHGVGSAQTAQFRDGFADQLEETSGQLTDGMTTLGVRIPRTPSAEHLAKLAQLKSAPSRFDALPPAQAETEAEVSLA